MLACMERTGCPPDVMTIGIVVAASCWGRGRGEGGCAGGRQARPAAELAGALRGGGHLAQAPGLLLEDIVPRDGCAAQLDA
jgi:hypothetical protein